MARGIPAGAIENLLCAIINAVNAKDFDLNSLLA
tara:strand:- start:89 stop:190 length:102 start_codon:yes stop_codon:yes gene_type:complete